MKKKEKLEKISKENQKNLKRISQKRKKNSIQKNIIIVKEILLPLTLPTSFFLILSYYPL